MSSHKITKPMLAATLENIEDLKYPVLVTRKLDGIRAIKLDGKLLSRSFKLIPNKYTQNLISNSILPDGVDGELLSPGKTFQETTGDVMREAGEPNLTYYIFDYVKDKLDKPYLNRMVDLSNLKVPGYCIKLLPTTIKDSKALLDYEKQQLDLGYEGVMVRSMTGPYKCGRATVNEGYLLKLKRFTDAEAVIVGFEEQQTNNNIAEKDNFGRTKRSSAKAGLVPAGTLGKFLVKDSSGTEFGIGTGEGLTHELRKQIWDSRDKYLGKTVKFKYQKCGTKDAPRIPVWIGFRDERDIS